jgi:putative intracellular protease/amidase
MADGLSRRELCASLLAIPAAGMSDLRRTDVSPHNGDLPETTSTERLIAFIAYPDLTLLDLVGPLQVVRGLDAPYRAVVVAAERGRITADSGVAIIPQATFAEIRAPYVVVIPGGAGSVSAMADDAIQHYLISTARTAQIVASVCTGALPLAATGLLEGRRASVHWAYANELEKLGARYVRARWTEDGKFLTSGGASAGIDMALELVARLNGREAPQRIQLGLEYDPQPPFGGIDWSRVGPEDLARQREGGTGRRLARARELLARRPDLLRRLGLDK